MYHHYYEKWGESLIAGNVREELRVRLKDVHTVRKLLLIACFRGEREIVGRKNEEMID